MEKFRVVHIQKSVLSTGRAPLRLHNVFSEEGIDSSILALEFDVNLTDRITLTGRNSRIIARLDDNLHRFINRRVKSEYGLFSFPVLGTNVSKNEQVKNADIIYVHWVQGGFLNISNYRQLARLGKPVIIVMHDMWTITGGCHHSFDCNKYMTLCSSCPMFKERGIIDLVRLEFRRKKRLYSEFENLHFVSPSKWLFNCTKQSFLTKDKPVHHIPNIVDADLFKPLGRGFARRMLNINESVPVVAFGAFSISSPYKGWSELLKALKILSSDMTVKNLTLLIFGAGYNKEIAESVPFNVRFLGFLKDEYSTVMVYNAADVFVTPSLADNFPTTVLESLSCGTPVVGFDVGGIPDMIIHKKNGYLARYREAEDLAEGIRFCMGKNIKGSLLPEFGKRVLMERHINLINSVLR